MFIVYVCAYVFYCDVVHYGDYGATAAVHGGGRDNERIKVDAC